MKKVKLLIVACLIASVSFTSCEKEIEGCTDIEAINYNSNANKSGTCSYDAILTFFLTQSSSTDLINSGLTSIKIYINNEYAGILPTNIFFASIPTCGENGTLEIPYQLGTNKSTQLIITVTDNNNIAFYSGVATLKAKDCLKIAL